MTRRHDPAGSADDSVFSRILVAFPGAETSAGLIDTATFLARALRAELRGLYIREDAIRDLAGLPVSTVSSSGAGSGPVTVEAMEQAWLREEERCRHALSRAAMHGHLAWSFETRSGHFGACLSQEVRSGDLVTLIEDQPATLSRTTLIETARRTVRLSGAVMVAARFTSARTVVGRPLAVSTWDDAPVLAIDDGDPQGARTIALAARIAAATGRPLYVLAIGEPDVAGDIEARARAIANDPGLHVHRVSGWMSRGLSAALDHVAPSLVVADIESPTFADETVARRLLRATKVPMIFLGQTSGREADAPAAEEDGQRTE